MFCSSHDLALHFPTICAASSETSAAKHYLDVKYKPKVSNLGYCAKFWMNAGTEAGKCVKIFDFQK